MVKSLSLLKLSKYVIAFSINNSSFGSFFNGNPEKRTLPIVFVSSP